MLFGVLRFIIFACFGYCSFYHLSVKTYKSMDFFTFRCFSGGLFGIMSPSSFQCSFGDEHILATKQLTIP